MYMWEEFTCLYVNDMDFIISFIFFSFNLFYLKKFSHSSPKFDNSHSKMHHDSTEIIVIKVYCLFL